MKVTLTSRTGFSLSYLTKYDVRGSAVVPRVMMNLWVYLQTEETCNAAQRALAKTVCVTAQEQYFLLLVGSLPPPYNYLQKLQNVLKTSSLKKNL